jgi:glycolate oxidase iron-sulfur subunit
MQTELADWIRDTPEGKEADRILRKCVHCGFCNATCPTYQLLGDELDGPRGRIYLMKQVVEGQPVTEKTRLHLDRCLTCRSCETTCPSGVEYGRLVDIGRGLVEQVAPRSIGDNAKRRAIATFFPQTDLFGLGVKAGQALGAVLPPALREKLPQSVPSAGAWPIPRHARRMLTLAGCVQPALDPGINAATARVLDRLGISLVEAEGAGCCGALRFHLNYQEAGRDDMRELIDAWWPQVESGAEAIVVTASGCGGTVKEYGHHLEHDDTYAARAAHISGMTRDVSEVVAAELPRLEPLFAKLPPLPRAARRMAFHSPCSLQHGLKIRGVVERILVAAGWQLVPVPDGHLCCGSAGTYSILQPELANQLKANKIAALQSNDPVIITSANLGCMTHLASGTAVPIKHWIVALDERLAGLPPA